MDLGGDGDGLTQTIGNSSSILPMHQKLWFSLELKCALRRSLRKRTHSGILSLLAFSYFPASSGLPWKVPSFCRLFLKMACCVLFCKGALPLLHQQMVRSVSPPLKFRVALTCFDQRDMGEGMLYKLQAQGLRGLEIYIFTLFKALICKKKRGGSGLFCWRNKLSRAEILSQ